MLDPSMLRTLLGGLDPAEFLSSHWQKRPLLVRGAIDVDRLPFRPEELAGLAGEPDATSRLITMPDGEKSWDVRNGPFTAKDFAALPDVGWSLLVQEVDQWIEPIAELLERFRFIPNWRLDDAMVSYAPDGAGVGAHLDRYDVFLIQIHGRRRWRYTCEPVEERLLPGVELRILETFEPDEDQLLEPGDMLYLPPKVAHEGVAVGDCMTCSVGFRAPDPRELCSSFLTQLPPRIFEAIRYADPDLELPSRVGEIPAAARAELRRSAAELYGRQGEFDRWIGRFVTTPKRDRRPTSGDDPWTADRLLRHAERGEGLERSAPAHFGWYTGDDGIIELFVGGEGYSLPQGQAGPAEFLCGTDPLAGATLVRALNSESFMGILLDAIYRGYLTPTGDD